VLLLVAPQPTRVAEIAKVTKIVLNIYKSLFKVYWIKVP
jgi:hypothetical protein